MALILPEPLNEKERQADTILRALDLRLGISPGTPLNILTRGSIRIIQETNPDPLIQRCAGIRLVRAIPLTDRTPQWALLTVWWCTPADEITANTIHVAVWYGTVLTSMHIMATTARPATISGFKTNAISAMGPLLAAPGLPLPPLVPLDIITLRRAYVGLVNRYYSL
ncbi:MAG: hypothetical protein ACYTAO_02425 [Planctomycetota bacterium]|jgi:hypothetical protein